MSKDSPSKSISKLGEHVRIAIVAARFNQEIVDELIDGCRRRLAEAAISGDRLEIHRVPGAFELPVASKALAQTKQFAAVICLGCVIRGDTPHFDYVAGEAARGIQQVGLSENLPVIFGVLTTNTKQQALDRIGGSHGHAGENAADAAIEMVALLEKIREMKNVLDGAADSIASRRGKLLLMSLNHELSDLFASMAAIMEIKGESVFKSIAFSKVSRLLKDMSLDIRQRHAQGKLAEIEGIGASSRKIIEEYITTGSSDDAKSLAASVPAGLIPMLQIPGLGPKTIALFWKQRGVTSVDELVTAIDQGKLDGIKGVGEKKIESIKQGIALLAKGAGRMGIMDAMEVASALLEELRRIPHVKQAEIAGSLRRQKETVGDVDLVCACRAVKNPAEQASLRSS